jgi:hypothetical protein
MKNPFHFTVRRLLGSLFGVAVIICICLQGSGGMKPIVSLPIGIFLLVVFTAEEFGTID